MRTRVRTALAALAVVSVAAAVTWVTSPARDADYLSDHMRERLSLGAGVRAHKNVLDLLPNVTVQSERGARPAAAAVVVGRVVEVEKGAAFKAQGEDSAGGTKIDFDDPSAQWKTVHLRLQVEDDFGRGKWEGQVLPVGLALGRDVGFSSARSALMSFPRVVLFLNTGSAVFDYDPNLYAIVQSGATFTTVDDDGTLRAPFAEFEGQMLGGARTLDDLRRASAGPDRVINFPF